MRKYILFVKLMYLKKIIRYYFFSLVYIECKINKIIIT
jgi:hypothetical protein